MGFGDPLCSMRRNRHHRHIYRRLRRFVLWSQAVDTYRKALDASSGERERFIMRVRANCCDIRHRGGCDSWMNMLVTHRVARVVCRRVYQRTMHAVYVVAAAAACAYPTRCVLVYRACVLSTVAWAWQTFRACVHRAILLLSGSNGQRRRQKQSTRFANRLYSLQMIVFGIVWVHRHHRLSSETILPKTDTNTSIKTRIKCVALARSRRGIRILVVVVLLLFTQSIRCMFILWCCKRRAFIFRSPSPSNWNRLCVCVFRGNANDFCDGGQTRQRNAVIIIMLFVCCQYTHHIYLHTSYYS